MASVTPSTHLPCCDDGLRELPVGGGAIKFIIPAKNRCECDKTFIVLRSDTPASQDGGGGQMKTNRWPAGGFSVKSGGAFYGHPPGG